MSGYSLTYAIGSDFYPSHPDEGYRRVTDLMMDADIVAADKRAAGRRRFWKIVKESIVALARNEPKIDGYNRSDPLGLPLKYEPEKSSSR